MDEWIYYTLIVVMVVGLRFMLVPIAKWIHKGRRERGLERERERRRQEVEQHMEYLRSR